MVRIGHNQVEGEREQETAIGEDGECGKEGAAKSITDVWLNNRELNEFVHILKENKLSINTLFECSRDELFEIFKGIGLQPHECVTLRSAITNDKQWKGGLDVFWALKEKSYVEVERISLKILESSGTISKVDEANIAVNRTCDEYLDAIISGVEKIRYDAHDRIEQFRSVNQETLEALNEAQQIIRSIVKSLPIHDNKGREEGITETIETVRDRLKKTAKFGLNFVNSPEPDFSSLKNCIDSIFIDGTELRWDQTWKSNPLVLSNDGLTVTAPKCQVGPHLSVRGSIGWTTGKHSWKLQLITIKSCTCVSSRGCKCYYSTMVGVCSDSMLPDEVREGKFNQKSKNVGYCFDAFSIFPRCDLVSGCTFQFTSGGIVELALDLTTRTLRIQLSDQNNYVVLRVPQGKIYPWVKLRQSPRGDNSCALIHR